MKNTVANKEDSPRFLIIQTAFIGDVVLATALIKSLKKAHPMAQIEVVVRKGNEGLLKADPNISRLWVWNKEKNKLLNLIRIGFQLLRVRYSAVITVQRYFSAGWLGLMARTSIRTCFKQNPLAWFYSHTYPHDLSGIHEVQRNQLLLTPLLPQTEQLPQAECPYLIPPQEAIDKVNKLINNKLYYIIAPASVWQTKQTPVSVWEKVVKKLPEEASVFLVGGPNDHTICREIASYHPKGVSLSGKISLIETFYLMKFAQQVFVNDSAPLHLASAANAPTTAFFCSTVPQFGFRPLADKSQIIENKQLICRPCGVHGHKACPFGHFRCGNKLPIQEIQFW